MNQSNYVGIIFDVDGVLIDSADAHYRSWKTLAEENGRTITKEQFLATFGRQNRDIIPLLFGDVVEDRMRALSHRKEMIYRDLIRKNMPIVPGAAELIQKLHERGARLAVGSSAPRENIDLVLKAMHVKELFDVIISADDVRRGKPDPQVFSVAIERLGTLPNRSVVIEDAPIGVLAAHAAGAKAVAVLVHHSASEFDRPEMAVKRLADIRVDDLLSLVHE